MEESECDFGEVEDTKSSIRPQALAVPAADTGVSHDPPASSLHKTNAWQYEVSDDRYESPPLFSQLRYHIILKGLELRNIEAMKGQLTDKFLQQFKANVKNIFIKRIKGGQSANAYIGFQYDYEAYKVLKQGASIKMALSDLRGGLGIPEQKATELFAYLIKKNEEIIRQQAQKYQAMRQRSPSDSSREKRSKMSVKEYRPQDTYRRERSNSRSSHRRHSSISRRRSRSAEKYRKVFVPESNTRESRHDRSSSRRRKDSSDYERDSRSSSSRSISRGKNKRVFEPSSKSFNVKEKSQGYSISQLEEGEIISKKAAGSRLCYAYGIPFKTTTNDVLDELKHRGLTLPKDMEFIKQGNLMSDVDNGNNYLRMKFDKQDYIKELMRKEVKILGQYILIIQCEHEVLLIWEL